MSEQGSAATSMRQLANACGVRVAALYHYFESKDALLAAVIAERNYTGRLAAPIDVDRGAPLADRLGAVFDVIWSGALDEEAVWRLLLGEGIRSEPAALPVGRDLLGTVRPGVAAYLREFVPELASPDLAADVLIGQMFFGFIRHFFEPDLDPGAIGADCRSVFVRTAAANVAS